MDKDLLERAGGRPGVIVALASRPGREYTAAVTNGVRHFTALGGTMTAAPDYRSDPEAGLAAVALARLLVLPGGSPTRLRTVLVGTALGAAVVGVLRRGGVVMGASAGAMVLCGQMWLPDGGDRIVAGLGAVTGVLVLPHYTGGPPPIEAPDGVDLLGVPECSGVLITPDGMMGVGANPSVRIGPDGEERPV